MNILAPLRGADFDAAPLPVVRVLCAPLGPIDLSGSLVFNFQLAAVRSR